MPEQRSCKSGGPLRDANNNNTYPDGGGGGGGMATSPHGGGATMQLVLPSASAATAAKLRNVQVTAKVLFGSVHAITRLKQEEKAARENKRI